MNIISEKNNMNNFFKTTILSMVFLPSVVLAVNLDEIDQTVNQINSVAEQTSTTLNKAKQLIRVATTTAGVAVDAYNKTEKAVSSTIELVKRGSVVYYNLRRAVLRVGNWWNDVTNFSEPYRVAIVIGGIIIAWVIIRFVL